MNNANFNGIIAIGTVCALIVLVVAAGTVVFASGTVTSASPSRVDDHPTRVAETVPSNNECQPPLDLRKRAKKLRSELGALPTAVVSSATLSDIDARIKRGHTNLNLDRHCQAAEAYESAITIVEPALSRAYVKATRSRLAEIDGMLAAEEADGNPDPDVGILRERSNRIREELRDAESLEERRDLYQRADQLQTDTREKLPTTLGEQAVEAVVESPFVAGLAALLSLVVVVETHLLVDAYRESGDSVKLSSRGD